MRNAFRGPALALALLAGAGTAAGAQIEGGAPVHVHRESTPPPRAQATDVAGRVKVHLQLMAAAQASALFPQGPRVYVMNLKAMVPAHTQLVTDLLEECAAGMVAAAAEPDHAAALDAVRQDLAQLQEMGSSRLGGFLPRHVSRVNRLLAFHRAALRS